MEFVNLTPHAISIVANDGDDSVFTVAPSGTVARVEMTESKAESLCDQYGNEFVAVIRRTAGAVSGIPASVAGTVYLVSSMVLDAMRGTSRVDVFAPDTGASAIRQNGQVVAVRRLVAA